MGTSQDTDNKIFGQQLLQGGGPILTITEGE